MGVKHSMCISTGRPEYCQKNGQSLDQRIDEFARDLLSQIPASSVRQFSQALLEFS